MKVLAFQIFSNGPDFPLRLEMIAEGIEPYQDNTSESYHNGWKIWHHGTETVTFSHEWERYRADATELGIRRGLDLCHLYDPDSPAWEAFHETDRWLRAKPEPSGDMYGYEGRFNVSGALSRAVYPVHVFSAHSHIPVPQELFMPVTALNELMQTYEYDYHLTPALAPAIVGDVVFELHPIGKYTGRTWPRYDSLAMQIASKSN